MGKGEGIKETWAEKKWKGGDGKEEGMESRRRRRGESQYRGKKFTYKLYFVLFCFVLYFCSFLTFFDFFCD